MPAEAKQSERTKSGLSSKTRTEFAVPVEIDSDPSCVLVTIGHTRDMN
jgi:hypothetical protein